MLYLLSDISTSPPKSQLSNLLGCVCAWPQPSAAVISHQHLNQDIRLTRNLFVLGPARLGVQLGKKLVSLLHVVFNLTILITVNLTQQNIVLSKLFLVFRRSPCHQPPAFH